MVIVSTSWGCCKNLVSSWQGLAQSPCLLLLLLLCCSYFWHSASVLCPFPWSPWVLASALGRIVLPGGVSWRPSPSTWFTPTDSSFTAGQAESRLSICCAYWSHLSCVLISCLYPTVPQFLAASQAPGVLFFCHPGWQSCSGCVLDLGKGSIWQELTVTFWAVQIHWMDHMLTFKRT